MTLAVLGLIAVQLYWITNALQIEEERFNANVGTVLTSVIDKLDKQETAKIVLETVDVGDRNAFFFKDDSSGLISTEVTSPDSGQSYFHIDSLQSGKMLDVNIKVTKSKGQENITHVVSHSKRQSNDSIFHSRKIFKVQSGKDSSIVKRRQLVDDIILKWISTGETLINQRINETIIDSLLTEELANKGIYSKFNFGIQNADSNQLIIVSDGASIDKLIHTDYRVNLFPEDIFGEPHYLLVDFEGKKSHIVKSIWVMLVLSGGLILIIIGVFSGTVQLLLRQKKLTELKNDLINNITHEFKTPISTISLACEALNEPELLEKQSNIFRYTKMIKSENDRLTTLVESLLNTAALEKGNYYLNKSDLDLHEVIQAAAEKFKIIADKKEIKIETSLTSENYMISADKFHISNIMDNLLDNAVKYNGKGIVIKISTHDKENGIHIIVQDNGIGIDRKNQKKIFDTFYRVTSGNVHDVKGYGIGLSYVKKMVEAHKGTITVSGKKHFGTSFDIYLPRDKNE